MMIQILQEHIVEAVSIIILAIGTAVASWIKKAEIGRMFKRRRARIQTRKMSAIYRADRALKSAVIDAGKIHNADRALIFNAHNCGKELIVGGLKYTSATFGYAHNPNNPNQSPFEHGEELVAQYQQVPLTVDYLKMLEIILNDGFYHFRTDDHKGAQLYDYYKNEGITDSYVFLAWSSDYATCYWSAATFREGGFTDNEVTALKLLAQTSRSHCHDAHE